MEAEETKSSPGYGKPPWIFKGRALYQLHLVKAETARAFIPKDFRLVEAFGYTLGGFFLANYDESPAGVFDELVVIAGTLWNPPTSCAWAAKVLVNSNAACDHGRKDVGLPSQVAKFSKRIASVPKQVHKKANGLLSMLGMDISGPTNQMDVLVSEINNPRAADICSINLTTFVPTSKLDEWKGPTIKMSLPSFSGRTQYNHNLLKYSCHIECRVRAVSPLKVSQITHTTNTNIEQGSSEQEGVENEENRSLSVMLSKPILALEFSCLKMQVEAPTIISPSSSSTTTTTKDSATYS